MKLGWLVGLLLAAAGAGGGFALVVHAAETAIPAMEEPRHRMKLENEYVRVLDIEIPPGDQTLFHTHDLNYAYLMVNDALLRNEVMGQPGSVELKITAGLVGYYRANAGAYTHRFTNIGSEPFRAIGIELLRAGPSPDVTAPLPDSSGYVAVLDNERVRAYRLVLEPGQSTSMVTVPGPGVRVAATAGKLEQQSAGTEPVGLQLAPGRFEFRARPVAQSLKNVGDARVEIYEFELK